MAISKTFIGAWGVVLVGASECRNTTLSSATQSGDVAVDSKGNVWFTTNLDDKKVWLCPTEFMGQFCITMGSAWDWPSGIAVDDSGEFPVVYVADGDSQRQSKVKKCIYKYGQPEEFSCSEFGSDWESPRGMALDNEGNVFITNAYGQRYGVWKCSPDADCVLVGDSNRWPHFPPDCVAADSKGNVYVTGGYEDEGDANYVKKCANSGGGICSDFGGDWPKGGGYDNAIAVGPDGYVYISDSGTNTLIRCSPDNSCENMGAFDGGHNMVIDHNGVFYVADGGDGGALRRVCLSPLTEDIQV